MTRYMGEGLISWFVVVVVFGDGMYVHDENVQDTGIARKTKTNS